MKRLILSLFVLSFFTLNAQNTLELSLDSAVNYAIVHNKVLINSKFAIDKSGQKVKEAISQGLPQVSATADYNNFLGAEAELKFNSMAPATVIKFNPTSSFKASATQLIFNGNYFVGLQMAKLAKTISEKNYQKSELDVKEQTYQAYYMILCTKRILNKLKENYKNTQSIYKNTENLAKVGMIEQVDVKKLSVMVTSVANAVKSTERQVEFGYNMLRFQLGLSSDIHINLTTTLKDIENKYDIVSNQIDTFNIKNNIDYQLASIQGDMMRKSIKNAKASYLPSLVAVYSYTKQIKKPNFNMTPEHVLSLRLDVPIFAGGLRQSKLNQARIDFNMSQNTKDILSDQLLLQQKQLKYDFNNLLEQYKSQKENVDVAKYVLDQTNLKFNQGIVSSLDLTSANNDYIKAETDVTSTILKLLNEELAIKKLNNNL